MNNRDLQITKIFDAPIELVWKTWTQPEYLIRWYAPSGCTIEFRSIEVKTGGEFHSCIHDPVHGDCWIKGIYHEVVSSEKLIFSMVLSNEQGSTVASLDAGKPKDWPETIVTMVTFVAVDKQTEVTIHQTVAEIEAKKTGAYRSWFSMFDRLQALLSTNN